MSGEDWICWWSK